MKKFIVNIICAFIPSKIIRGRVRNYFIGPKIQNKNSIAEFLKNIKNTPKKNISRLDNVEWKNAYSKDIKNVKSKIKNDEFVSEWTVEMERLTKPGQSVIEIGCALGITSLYLAKRGRVCTGLDFSKDMCDSFVKIGDGLGLDVNSINADITKKLPIDDNSFDVVFHAGVIEHFSDDEVQFIINENARIAKDMVVCMAPNANSVAYRIGKEYHERNGTWIAGEENPKSSLKDVFVKAGLKNITEYTIDLDFALAWLPEGELRTCLTDIYKNLPTADNCGQGYLLVTIGHK